MTKKIDRLMLHIPVWLSHFSFYGYIFIFVLIIIGAIIALLRQEWFSTTIFSLITLVGILFFTAIKKQYQEEVRDFKKKLKAEE